VKLLSKKNIPPIGRDETVFRISFWGAFFSLLFILTGLLAGVAVFFIGYHSSRSAVMTLSALYTLVMWGICLIIFRTLRATRSPANWLARIGSGGVLLKYRSYLHDDSPGEDPIALHLSWHEIADAQLHQEIHTTTDSDGKSHLKRWFLVIRLDPRFLNIAAVKGALEFEVQRKPAHFRVDDLKHELFIARKNRAAAGEISRLKAEIAGEKKLHPGKQSKTRFCDRPIVFISPDLLKLEWTHITPGRKKLRELLAQRVSFIGEHKTEIDIETPMTQAEFQALLATLLSREEKLEAIKLVRYQLKLSSTEAVAFIEKSRIK
jgi:hypothetical protein